MTRLRIVPLPTSEPEYLIVIDELGDEDVIDAVGRQSVKEATGARGVLVFDGPVEVLS